MMSSAGKIHQLEEAVSYLQTDRTSVESETIAQHEEEEPQTVIQTESDLADSDRATEAESDGRSGEDAKPETEGQLTSETAAPAELGDIAPEETGQTGQPEDVGASSGENEQVPSIKPQEEKQEPDVQETTAFADQDYYIVQKGESLLGISQKIYGKDYTEQLCTLNELEDENKIYAGQKLLLLDK